MAPLLKKSDHPFVKYDKAGLRKLLSCAIITGRTVFAHETRACIRILYCVETCTEI